MLVFFSFLLNQGFGRTTFVFYFLVAILFSIAAHLKISNYCFYNVLFFCLIKNICFDLLFVPSDFKNVWFLALVANFGICT
jgi:hypothetical protein